jgi:hypothetical protein
LIAHIPFAAMGKINENRDVGLDYNQNVSIFLVVQCISFSIRMNRSRGCLSSTCGLLVRLKKTAAYGACYNGGIHFAVV